MPINLFELGAATPAVTGQASRSRAAARSADALGAVAADRPERGQGTRGSKGLQAVRNAADSRSVAKGPSPAATSKDRLKGPKGAASDEPGRDPFMAVIREAVSILNKAVKATQKADDAAAPAVEPDAEVTAALNLLAQMAQFAQGLPVQVPSSDNLGASAALMGTGALDALTAGDSGHVHLDPRLLQALFGQPSSDAAEGPAEPGMTAPGHLPLGQPLPPETVAELRDLRAQMGQLQQQLAAILKEHGSPAVVMPSPDEAAPVAETPSAEATPAVPVTPPVNPAPTAPVEAPKAAATRPVSSAAAQRQAAIEMLLKPMRGELTVESGDFALKGLRTDVTFQAPADNAKLLQSLVEQGKQVVNQMPEGETLAEALGIRQAPETDDAAMPVSRTEAGNLLLDALTDEAVVATTAAESTDDGNDPEPGLTADGPQVRTDEMFAGKLALAQADGVGGVSGGDGPRAQQAIMQQVIDKVKELTPGPAQVRMVLNPESLGQVTIRLVAHQGEVSVRIITENSDAQKLLDGGMNHLKAALADSGIRLDQATVVTLPAQSEHRQDGQAHHRQPQPEQPQRQAAREASAEEQAALDELTALLQGRPA